MLTPDDFNQTMNWYSNEDIYDNIVEIVEWFSVRQLAPTLSGNLVSQNGERTKREERRIPQYVEPLMGVGHEATLPIKNDGSRTTQKLDQK